MNKPYDLLNKALTRIEKGLKQGINSIVIAHELDMSTGHLHRLFRFAFNQTIGSYIRSRKLSASIDELLTTDMKVIDIALEYDFDFEQSYIRSFKREFGITPGELRKSGQVIKVKPPLHLFNENRLGEEGLFFGPDIVIVPKFFVIGKYYSIPFHDTLIVQDAAIEFWKNERHKIINVINPDVYIGMTKDGRNNDELSEYLPSLQVSLLDSIPEGLSGFTFDTKLCARFRYIGQHHYYELNRNTAKSMYNAIHNFASDEQAKYVLKLNEVYFERIDTRLYDGTYCQMEWFTPVIEKQ